MSQIQTLPELDSPYPISSRQQAEYRHNGHILLRGVLDETEVAAYREAIIGAAGRYNTETRNLEERDTYGKAFLQIMNLWEVDERARRFTLANRFAGIAAALMGVERVRLYHDQALFKEAGGGHTPWHQDQYYWPIDTDNTITMWMPLVPVSVEMGMLTFASGSHQLGFIGNLAISDDSEALIGELVREKGYPATRATQMNAGDATFHSGWTLHCAPGNQSDRMREVMTVIYFADGARVTPPKNPHQEADRQRWLMGLEAGKVIDSALNPVVGAPGGRV
jgi:ectoine hydroxylase-related dioxygenase (phytanoyl-CoA dioxygenase family)